MKDKLISGAYLLCCAVFGYGLGMFLRDDKETAGV